MTRLERIGEAGGFALSVASAIGWYVVLNPATARAGECEASAAPEWAVPVGAIIMFCAVASIAFGELRNRMHWRRNKAALERNIEGDTR